MRYHLRQDELWHCVSIAGTKVALDGLTDLIEFVTQVDRIEVVLQAYISVIQLQPVRDWTVASLIK